MHKSFCAKSGLRFILIFIMTSIGLTANAELTSPWSWILPNNQTEYNDLTDSYYKNLLHLKSGDVSMNDMSWLVEYETTFDITKLSVLDVVYHSNQYYLYDDIKQCSSIRVGSFEYNPTHSNQDRPVSMMKFSTAGFVGKKISKVIVYGGPNLAESVYDISCIVDGKKIIIERAFDGSDATGPIVAKKTVRTIVMEPNAVCNQELAIEFKNPDGSKEYQGFRLCGIVVEFEENTMLPLIVEYNDEVQESDYLTLPVHSEILLSVGGNDNCHYVLSQKNDKTGQISEKVIANGKVTFNNAGRYVFNIDAVDDDSEKIVANRTLHIIVKDDSEINPGDYTLDFERYSYGMTLNPKDNIQTGTDKAFSGVDTNGLDFYIPSGAGYPDNRNQVALVKEDDGAQMLSLTNSGSFKINIDNYNLKITQIKVYGDNLSNLQVVSASHPQGLQMDNDSEFTYTPSDNSIVRDFEIRHSPLTRADAVPSHISHINISTAIETGVDSPVDDSALSDVSNVVYYSISGQRLIGEPTQRGIYIRKSNKGVRKILVR